MPAPNNPLHNVERALEGAKLADVVGPALSSPNDGILDGRINSQLLTDYTASLMERKLSGNTVQSYGSDIRNNFIPWLRKLQAVSVLAPAEVSLASDDTLVLGITAAQLRDYPKHAIEAGLGEGSVARHVASIKSLYRWLQNEGYLNENRSALMPSPENAPRESVFAPLTSVMQLTSMYGPRDITRVSVALALIFETGQNLSQVLHLRAMDISSPCATDGFCHVQIRAEGTKNYNEYSITPQLHRRLVAQDQATAAMLQRATIGRTGESPVFANVLGEELNSRHCTRILRVMISRAGLPPDSCSFIAVRNAGLLKIATECGLSETIANHYDMSTALVISIKKKLELATDWSNAVLKRTSAPEFTE